MPQTDHSINADRRTRQRKRILMAIAVLITLVILSFAVLLCMEVATAISERANEQTGPKQPDDPNPPDGKKEDPTDDPTPAGATVQCSAADVHCGNLLLVNASNPYTFDEPETRLTNIYNEQSSAKTLSEYYLLSGSALRMEKTAYQALDRMLKRFYDTTGKSDVLIRGAYRSYKDQQDSGSSVKPGYSDSHTGLSCELRVLSNKKTLDLSSSEIYNWIFDHCFEYGFTVRYPADKAEKTGVEDYDYYFRYVGYIHAYLMKQNNMCLEEYIDYLHRFTAAAPLSVVTDGRIPYEIYYVPATGETTEIPVPDESAGTYEISGDNIGGFIVTVKKAAQ